MDFEISEELRVLRAHLDNFIERAIRPLEEKDDNARFFDHRREWARTDFERGGLPRAEWHDLLREARRRADAAGFYRYALPRHLGGNDGTNLDMAVIREHLARRGLGLHNDLQSESSVIGSFAHVFLLDAFGTDAQKRELLEPVITGERRLGFALTEPGHGSDAANLETTAVRDGDRWRVNGVKRFTSGQHIASHNIVFARTSDDRSDARGITAFLVPTDAEGFGVQSYWWTFNMPTDHAEIVFDDVDVGDDAVLGEVGRGLDVAQHFVHENRIRQAASSLGAAQYCIDEAVRYANARHTWGRPLSGNQGIQFPLAELHTEAAMARWLIRYTAWMLDRQHHLDVTHYVAMCNYRANRLVCDAADRAMQVFGGLGYTRHEPFEHIYRHHRRYRITEGSDEIQLRKIGSELFGLGRGSKPVTARP